VVYALQFEVFWRNTARRDSSATSIATQLDSRSLYSAYVMTPTNRRVTGEPGIVLAARYNSVADRATDWAALDALLGTGVNGPVAGSRAFMHDCAVDEGVESPCAISQERTW
jgi:hypothetical protein